MEVEAKLNRQADATATARSFSLLVFPAAALAGGAALALELLWIRGLGRGVGTTHEALAAVTGLFLGGLGLGAALGGGRAVRSERPALMAAVAFLGAGVLAGLSPSYLAALPGLHDSLLDGLGIAGDGGAWPALALALPLVLPASFLFGYAFPFLVRARVLDVRRAGANTGWIYALNTLGAVAGVVATVVWLPMLGETAATRTAGAGALAAALLLLLIRQRLPHGSGPPAEVTLGKSSAAGGEGVALCVSGAAALLAQLAWFRMLQPLAGAHLWGVALLLAPLLLALAVGAACGGWLSDRVRRSELLLPVLLVLAGVLTFLSLPIAGGAPLRLIQGAGGSGAERIRVLILVFLTTVGPAVFFFGAALPAAVRVRVDATGTAADAAGRIYAWNALGALCGSILAGSLLLPHLGAERTLVLAGALPICAAAALRWRQPGKHGAGWAALHLSPLIVLLWPGLVDALLSTAPTTTGIIAARKPLPPGCTLEEREDVELYSVWFAGTRAARPGDAQGTPLPVFEGRAGRITLIEEPDGRVGLRRGALRESIFDPDRPERPAATEFALGLLPALLHRGPTSALVIGHGAGWTAEAVLAAGVEQVEIAELDEAVLDAARAYRGRKRLPVEQDERASLCACDGRILLRRAARRPAGERYDLIVSQPSHPWHPASGHLFTQEAFAAGKAALNDGGVLAQWLNLFDMTPDLLRSALASFRAVFDDVWLYRFPGEVVLIGFTQPPHVDVARWEAAFAEDTPLTRMARTAGYVNAGSLWKHLALDTAGLDRILPPETPTLHDDMPRLELELAWRRLTLAPPEDAEEILIQGFPPDMPAALPDGAARERWLTQAVAGWLDDGRPEEADLWSRRLRWGKGVDGRATQARAALASRSPERAAALLESTLSEFPGRGDLAALWLTALAAGPEPNRRESARVRLLAEDITNRFESDGRVLAAAARLHRTRGRIPEARQRFEQAVVAERPPAPPGTRAQLARLLLSEAFEGPELARARVLLEGDPAVFEDVDLLDQLLRLVSHSGDEERAETLERVLRTLQQAQGLAALRQAAGYLSRHQFGAALAASQHCRAIWPTKATVYELDALIHLAAYAASDAKVAQDDWMLEQAKESFERAENQSEQPESVRARARRMLRWFGHEMAPDDADASTDMGR